MQEQTSSVTNIAVLCLLAITICFPGASIAQSAVSLPFATDFEAGEGYVTGPLSSDASWQFGTDLEAEILSPGAGSSQGLGISGGDWLWLTTDDPGTGVSWVDFYLKPPFVDVAELPVDIATPQSGVTGFVQLDNKGEVYAVDGDGGGGGSWIGSGFKTPLDGGSSTEWIRLTYRLDYLSRSWDLFIDGDLMLFDLGFLDDTVDKLEEFSVFAGDEDTVQLDYFYAGHGNPLFTDTSGDGLPDDWLIARGLDPNVYQRYNDPDGDGLSNIEEYRGDSHPTEGTNAADPLVNLALLPDVTLSGSVSSGGKGAPDHILYDPATGDYVVQSNWAEYGVSHNQNLGTVDEANGFYWLAEWDSPKNINYITFGGAYPNQPQPHTLWKVQTQLDGVWTDLDSGQGGWVDSGIYEWGGPEQAPVVADAVRVVLFSDGSHDLVSIHLRGRGAAALSEDDTATTPKATLIQYLPETPPDPGSGGAGVKLILDTDFGPDCDDVGALAVLHALANDGLCEIVAVMASTSGSSIVGAIDAVNTYYGRPNIPIGLRATSFTAGDIGMPDDFAPTMADTDLYPSDQTNATAPDAVGLYRSLLANAEDDSIAIAVVGFQSNLSALLDSGANYNGDGIAQTGAELVAAKVTELSVMGGNFIRSDKPEFNIGHDAPAAQNVANNWPTPIVYSGFEIGENTKSGGDLQNPATNPVAKAYELYRWTDGGGQGVIGNRHSWDQTVTYYAVLGVNHETAGALWSLSQPGSATFDQWGNTQFAPSSTGTHRYLIQAASKAVVGDVIEDLMIQPPL